MHRKSRAGAHGVGCPRQTNDKVSENQWWARSLSESWWPRCSGESTAEHWITRWSACVRSCKRPAEHPDGGTANAGSAGAGARFTHESIHPQRTGA